MKKVLIVRNERFIKYKGELYITGSSSNELYRNNHYQIGEIEYLSWINYIDEGADFDVSQLGVKYVPIEGVTIQEHDQKDDWKKISIIRECVRNCDAVVAKLTIKDAFFAVHYARKFHKPYVIESGGGAYLSLWYHGGWKYKTIAIPLEILTRYYHRKSKYIAYVSLRYLQNMYPSKAKQIGCSDAVIMNTSEQVLMKRKVRIENHSGDWVLGLIGATHAEYRGHDKLIEAASILKSKGYSIQVRFAGGGKKNQERVDKARNVGIEDKVFFDGYLDKQGVYKWIDNIDVLVMPTKQETLGRAVIEAMSRGCPVVGSRETAISEQIGSDCLVLSSDIAGLVERVERIITSKKYNMACAYENFYRAKKYDSTVTNEIRKKFYDGFREDNNLI